MIKTKEKTIKESTVKDKLNDTSNIQKIKKKKDKKDNETVDSAKEAINSIENKGKITTVESTKRTKNYIVKKYRSHRENRRIKQRNEIQSKNNLDGLHVVTTNKRTSKSLIKHSQRNVKNNTLSQKINKRRNAPLYKMSFTNKTNYNKYTNQAKKLSMLKYRKKVHKSILMKGKKQNPKTITNAFGKTFSFIRRSVTSLKNVVSFGIGLIIMVVIVLFIGIFASLSDDSTVNSATEPLSVEVIEYRDTITKFAKQYDMEEYVSLIQAIMMNESQGKGNDPMQSSLFEYNTKYPREKNGISNAEYSIEVGIHFLSDCFKLTEVEGPYDVERISLMLQGYNYGKEYITWAKEYFGGYTRANAKVYADENKAELQVSTYGDPKYVSHVFRYYHLGNGDIVMVAKTQVGNIGGKPYWSWYGYDSRVEWCACFVSWCANESGQLNVTIPKFASVVDGIQWYKDKKLFESNEYIPKAGDLIFFDWEQDGKSDHVGIVEQVKNGNVYTVEGNSNDECREKSYVLGSNLIYGFGITNVGLDRYE